MKLKKYLLVALLAVLTLFVAVGCDSQNSILDDFLQVSQDVDSATEQYASKDLTEEDTVEALALSDNDYRIMTLSDDQEPTDLQRFNELRLEIKALHDQLVEVRGSIRTSYASIRNSVRTFKELGYVVLDDDKEIIREKITLLQGYKASLLETSGDAYQRIYDLRGTYTRENLSNILIVYEEVIEVLEYRLELFNLGLVELEFMDGLVKEYLGE